MAKLWLLLSLGGKAGSPGAVPSSLNCSLFLERVHHPFSLSACGAEEACIVSGDAVQIFARVLVTVF